jgi:hypothetical protein
MSGMLEPGGGRAATLRHMMTVHSLTGPRGGGFGSFSLGVLGLGARRRGAVVKAPMAPLGTSRQPGRGPSGARGLRGAEMKRPAAGMRGPLMMK